MLVNQEELGKAISAKEKIVADIASEFKRLQIDHEFQGLYGLRVYPCTYFVRVLPWDSRALLPLVEIYHSSEKRGGENDNPPLFGDQLLAYLKTLKVGDVSLTSREEALWLEGDFEEKFSSSQ